MDLHEPRLEPRKAAPHCCYTTQLQRILEEEIMAITIESIREAADSLKALLPADFRPEIGIIGGSGLSALEDAVEEPRWEVPYGKIKGFPVSTGK
jgi:hypothetical protein